MAKVITTLEICENAKMARDMALTGLYFMHFYTHSLAVRAHNLICGSLLID